MVHNRLVYFVIIIILNLNINFFRLSNTFEINKYTSLIESNCTDFNLTCDFCQPGHYFNTCESLNFDALKINLLLKIILKYFVN